MSGGVEQTARRTGLTKIGWGKVAKVAATERRTSQGKVPENSQPGRCGVGWKQEAGFGAMEDFPSRRGETVGDLY